MLKKIDNYYLNMPVKEMFDLRELTLEEYETFESVGMTRIFKDEKIYHGKDIAFLGAVWNVIVSSTGGTLYKIVLQNMNTEKKESDRIFKTVYDHLFQEMGKYSGYKSMAKRYIWDTDSLLRLISICIMFPIQYVQCIAGRICKPLYLNYRLNRIKYSAFN